KSCPSKIGLQVLHGPLVEVASGGRVSGRGEVAAAIVRSRQRVGNQDDKPSAGLQGPVAGLEEDLIIAWWNVLKDAFGNAEVIGQCLDLPNGSGREAHPS